MMGTGRFMQAVAVRDPRAMALVPSPGDQKREEVARPWIDLRAKYQALADECAPGSLALHLCEEGVRRIDAQLAVLDGMRA